MFGAQIDNHLNVLVNHGQISKNRLGHTRLGPSGQNLVGHYNRFGAGAEIRFAGDSFVGEKQPNCGCLVVAAFQKPVAGGR
jgi:hypothetical protein